MSQFVDYKLYPFQKQFVLSNRKFSLNSGGVGSGKTFATVIKSIRLMAKYPGIFGLIGAQTFNVVRNTVLREYLNFCPEQVIEKYNKSTRSIKWKNGSEILFVPFDDETKLKSLTIGFAGMVEMTDVREDIFKQLRLRLRQNKMPNQLFGDTNPAGFGNWVFPTFIGNPIANSEVIYSRSTDNRRLPSDYLDDLEAQKDTNLEYYKRMVEGLWGVMEGIIFDLPMNQRIDKPPKKLEFDRVIAGLDFGFTHPTSLVIIGVIGERYYIIDELYRYKLTSSEICQLVKEKVDEYNIDAVYCDYSRPEIIEDLKNAEVPAMNAVKTVFDGIMHVKSLISKKLLYVWKGCSYTLREFDSYSWDKRNTVKEVPIKANDHSMDAVRYCLFSDSRIEEVEVHDVEFA